MVTFKPYSQQQLMLLTNLNDVIPEKHLVRTVNAIVLFRAAGDALDEPVYRTHQISVYLRSLRLCFPGVPNKGTI